MAESGASAENVKDVLGSAIARVEAEEMADLATGAVLSQGDKPIGFRSIRSRVLRGAAAILPRSAAVDEKLELSPPHNIRQAGQPGFWRFHVAIYLQALGA